jgi:hypothetical protein
MPIMPSSFFSADQDTFIHRDHSTMLRISTIWEPIRNDPRFAELTAEKKT